MVDRFEDLVGEYLIVRFQEVVSRIGPSCESPIETGLFKAFVALWAFDRTIRFDGFITGPLETEWAAKIYTQFPVGQYRLDFAVHVTASAGGRSLSEWIGVECDGHEFHEKTKEQAARDKARDRELTAKGYRVLRFTGAEIYRDNVHCARQVLEMAYKLFTDWSDAA